MKTTRPHVKQAYDDHKPESDATGLKCTDPTLAQQQFKEECDINTIVERFHLTGEVPQLTELPKYADFEGVFDFQSAMNAVRQAQETFMSLPAKLRARFDNDPQKFVAFTNDDENLPEARKLGILSDDAIKRLDEAQAAKEAEKERQIVEKAEKEFFRKQQEHDQTKGKK